MAAADECQHEIAPTPSGNKCAKCGKRVCRARSPTTGIRCMVSAGHRRKEKKPHSNPYGNQPETWGEV